MTKLETGQLEGIALHAAERPGKAALIMGGVTRTYGELGQRTNRLAHALRALGVRPGGSVAAMLPNGFETFEVALATSRIGARFLPVNWHLKTDEVAWILADSGAAALFAHASVLGQAGLSAGAGCPLVVVGDGAEALAGERYEALLASAPEDAEILASAPTWAPMFYTSGTTGRPKGVVHGELDAARMAMSQQAQQRLWWWSEDDVYIVSGPAYHAGPGGWAMTALYVGATTVILESWDAPKWLELVGRHRVTRSFMVPSHFIRLLEVPEPQRAAADVSSLRLIVHGGAPCPVNVKRAIMEALAPAEIWELYGMSEGGATRIGPDEWRARPGSVGLPWPGVALRILDPSGAEVPPGHTGLIYVLPPEGARFSYHDDPAKTAEAWREQGFTVGDVGHVDADGYLFITDRASDMVIRGGVNIYPREVEDALYRHPAVVDCAVFGIPDERDGEHLKAVVEVRSQVTPEQLRDHCMASLDAWKCPSVVELVDALPRDPSGKVLKRLLREAHWAGRPSAVG